MQTEPPNNAPTFVRAKTGGRTMMESLRRTRPSRHCCNPCVPSTFARALWSTGGPGR